MKFSVLMSVYNRESPDYLRQSLNSIIQQSLPPSEILIVKDGLLTAELDGVIDKFAGKYKNLFKIISINENVGLGKALGIGVLNCKHDIIARMDSDDISDISRCEKQISFFKKNTNIDIVGSWIAEFERNPSDVISIRKVPQLHDEILRFSKFRNPVNHMTVVFKKDSVLKAGNYLHFPFFEDYYLWARMLKNGARFANIPESLVFARVGYSMLQRRKGKKYLIQEMKFHKRLLDIGFLSYPDFLRNLVVRIPLRLLNMTAVKVLYEKFARKK